MSTNQNIFALLSDDEGSDNDNNQQRSNQNKEKRIRTRGKKQQKPAEVQQQAGEVNRKEIGRKDHQQRGDHQQHRGNRGGVNHRQRSKDRQSGTGISGVQRNNFRKGGHGRGNVGTVREELNQQENAQVQEGEEEEEEEEVDDNMMTLEQYLQSKGGDLQSQLVAKQAVQQAIDAKQLESQLKKDKLELVQKKPEREEKVVRRNQQSSYKPGYQGEAADLVSFRTGFVADKRKKKVAQPQEGAQQQQGEQTQTQTQATEQQGEQQPQQEKQQQGDRRRNNQGPRGNNNRQRQNNNRQGNQQSRPNRGKGYNVESNDNDFPTL